MGRTFRNKSKQDKKKLREYRSLRRKRGIDNPNIANNNKGNKNEYKEY